MADAVGPIKVAAPVEFTNLRHAALASLYLGLSFTWLPYPVIVLPSEVREFFPSGQVNSYIGYATAIGAVFAVVIPPLVGAWSDRLTSSFGRRRPFMVAGVLAGVVGLLVMMTAGSYTQLLIGHVIAQIFLNGAAAAYYAIIPDIVPDAEFGKASGFLAGMQQGGGLLGFVLTAGFGSLHQVRLSFLVMAVVLVLSLVPVLWASRGEGARPVPPRAGDPTPLPVAVREFLRPLWSGDFGWVVFTRTMVTAGVAAVFYFLSSFFKDVVHVANTDQFTSIWLVVAFLAMIGPGVWGGGASDRYGRKRFVYAAGTLQVVVAAYFIAFYPNQQAIVIALGAIYGIGYGLYLAVDWALACDTIPDRAHAAKDMGLFHVAQTLPNSIIPAIEGPLIDHFNTSVAPNSGYRVAFGSVILFFTLGTVFVSRIRSVR
ncbi:MAG TPA: MFS transporter [Candidatus Dormibacteraeota bacterium]